MCVCVCVTTERDAYMWMCICVSMYVCMHAYMHACVCVCVHACVYFLPVYYIFRSMTSGFFIMVIDLSLNADTIASI